MNLRHLWLLSTAALLAACGSGQASRDVQFDQSSAQALLVMGVDVRSDYKRPSFLVRMFDPETGQPMKPQKTIHPRDDILTAGQKFSAYFTGQDARPGGHSYFVFELSAGHWFLEQVNGMYNDGFTSYSSTVQFSRGTPTFEAVPGRVTYLGEYALAGSYGGGLSLMQLPADVERARTELNSFSQVSSEMTFVEPKVRSYECVKTRILWGEKKCARSEMVIDISQ